MLALGITAQGDSIAELLPLHVALQPAIDHSARCPQQGHRCVLGGDEVATAQQGNAGQGATQHPEIESGTFGLVAVAALDAARNQGQVQVAVEIGQPHLQFSQAAGVEAPGRGCCPVGAGQVDPFSGLAEGRVLQGGGQPEDQKFPPFRAIGIGELEIEVAKIKPAAVLGAPF